jgi:hypothetical protein
MVITLVGSLNLLGCGQMDHQGNCGGGYLLCDYNCADPITDPQNCGSCGVVCEPDEVCNLGICQAEPQAGSLALAAHPDAYSPESIQPTGYMRPSTADASKWCAGNSQEGLVRCGNTCVNTRTDRSHCGECFNTCPGGTFCRSGACTSECPAGLTNCGGRCVNTRTIWAHCGACNRACASDEVCDWGECVLSCASALTDCDGSCVNLGFDRENCGECGESCVRGRACENGVCSSSCGGDLNNCGGVCVDFITDPEHCGFCNHACEINEICVHGNCELYGGEAPDG